MLVSLCLVSCPEVLGDEIINRKQLPQGEWTKTHAGIQFLMAEDSEGADKIVVFVSADIFQCHSEADKILVDGIFQTCPRMFYEVYTIHSFKKPFCVLSSSRQILCCLLASS